MGLSRLGNSDHHRWGRHHNRAQRLLSLRGSLRIFFGGRRQLPFGGSLTVCEWYHFEPYPWTSRDPNHHRQSVWALYRLSQGAGLRGSLRSWPRGLVGRAPFLTAQTDYRWWFESLLVHEQGSMWHHSKVRATRRKAMGAATKKSCVVPCASKVAGLEGDETEKCSSHSI